MIWAVQGIDTPTSLLPHTKIGKYPIPGEAKTPCFEYMTCSTRAVEPSLCSRMQSWLSSSKGLTVPADPVSVARHVFMYVPRIVLNPPVRGDSLMSKYSLVLNRVFGEDQSENCSLPSFHLVEHEYSAALQANLSILTDRKWERWHLQHISEWRKALIQHRRMAPSPTRPRLVPQEEEVVLLRKRHLRAVNVCIPTSSMNGDNFTV
mmetsp:Transcript_33751/g.132671  ORF Transcript_33751/g.132671 Transcript_33751/m.132671 type:complete len:206 (+) Transcript_33751:1056-1673(+)